MKIKDKIIGLGLIGLLGYCGVKIIQKDIRYFIDINRLGNDMRNAPFIEYVVEKEDTYPGLLKKYFQIKGGEFRGIREWGDESNITWRLYCSAIGIQNNWDVFSLRDLKEGETIKVPVRK